MRRSCRSRSWPPSSSRGCALFWEIPRTRVETWCHFAAGLAEAPPAPSGRVSAESLGDSPDQLGESVRFLDQGKIQLTAQGLGGISRGQDDPQIGPPAVRRLCDLEAAHAVRHDEIAEHQIDAGIVVQQLERLWSVASAQHAVTARFESFDDGRVDVSVVLDD